MTGIGCGSRRRAGRRGSRFPTKCCRSRPGSARTGRAPRRPSRDRTSTCSRRRCSGRRGRCTGRWGRGSGRTRWRRRSRRSRTGASGRCTSGANLSGHHGRHEWKAGGDADFASIREQFGYRIVAYRVNGVRIFDRDTPPVYNFAGRAQDREQSAYVQDVIRLGSVTVSAGLRFDHYRLLADETAWSPRLAVSWHYRPLDLVLRASY